MMRRQRRPAARQGWELDEHWRQSVGYLLRREARDEVSGNAIANAISLNLNWTLPEAP